MVKKVYNISMEYTIVTLDDTDRLARRLADKLQGREIILLSGELAAGKTTFTKSLAKYLGIKETLTSPTFAFMREYYGRMKLSHYDMYRVESEDELWELGLSDNLYEDGVCVIEWNKFTEFPDGKIIITIDITKAENCRVFDVRGIEL